MALFRLPRLRPVTSTIEAVRERLTRRGHRSAGQGCYRRLAIDPLEERVLLSVSPVNVDDRLVSDGPGDVQYTTPGRSLAVDHDGDFVVVWSRSDDLVERDPMTGDPILDPDGEPIPIIDPNTGFPPMDPETGYALTDYNVYARYYTDEVQRVILPQSVLEADPGDNYVTFSLAYGGPEVQKISISATYEPFVYGMLGFAGQESLYGTFAMDFDADGSGTIDLGETTGDVFYDERYSPKINARGIEDALRQLDLDLGGGTALADVKVEALNAFEFLVNFSETTSGQDQPQLTVNNIDFFSGFLPAVEITTISEQIIIADIRIGNRFRPPKGSTSLNRPSGWVRSRIHRKLAKRSSMALRNTTKRAKNTGIWITMGRQPPMGLTLCSL